MSARPRPVTATVTKQKDPKNEHLQQIIHGSSRNLDSSSDSTLSLISVLDHDSYESDTDSDNENDGKNSLSKDYRSSYTETAETDSRTCIDGTKTSDTDRTTYESSNVVSAKNKGPVSAWEIWFVQKEKDLRKRAKEKTAKIKLEQEQKQKEEQEKIQKKIKAQENRKEWLTYKAEEEKRKKQNEKETRLIEKKKKENKENEAQEKAKEIYKEWSVKKFQEEKQKWSNEKEKQRLKEQEEEQKRCQNEAAFEEWCKKAQQRSKPIPNSFGYTCGKLTGYANIPGYHDASAYPVPSFYNPVPWCSPTIPSEKSRDKRKKKTVKYKWDPKKYY